MSDSYKKLDAASLSKDEFAALEAKIRSNGVAGHWASLDADEEAKLENAAVKQGVAAKGDDGK